MSSGRIWRESYEGGSPEAEALHFAELARDIMDVQLANRASARASDISRAFHAKCILGIGNAILHVLSDIPEVLEVGFFERGKQYDVTVRLSSASGTRQADFKKDMRGIAIRVKVSGNEYHDFLATNFPVSHARNAYQFVAFAKAMAGSKLLLLPRLVLAVGFSETIRMLRNVMRGARVVDSLATEAYWSRGALLWGNDAGPVRFLLRPSAKTAAARPVSATDPDFLHREIAARLRDGPVEFDFLLQRYVDEKLTPIEDGAVEWTEDASRPIRVATLTIPSQDIDAAPGRAMERLVDELAFNPWNTTETFRPLGNLNRVRKAAYTASAAHRLNQRFRERKPLRNIVVARAVAALFKAINASVPWYKFGWRMSLLNISVLREQLRTKNLFDTELPDAPPQATQQPPTIPEVVRTQRTFDGTYNDLSSPRMGAEGATFGRTMRPVYKPELFGQPNPIEVSRQLMTRKAFIPARSLNVLAAAWIQFQVHDWVNHKRHDLGNAETDIALRMPNGELWTSSTGGQPEAFMRIAGNEVFRTAAGNYPVFKNITTPWWDGSEVYGNTAEKALYLRDGGRLKLTEDLYLPTELNGMNVTGFNESWWLGLSMMHTLFAREHNVLAAALMREYPDWEPDRIYHTARLIVSALIAKIHTTEWTPAILATRAIKIGLPANWYGAPKDWLTQLGIWMLDTHELKGIPQTTPDHHGIPYSLTEEFVSVYRLHPLIPDDYQFFNHETGAPTETLGFADIQGSGTDAKMRQLRLHNVIYSLGIAHPGAITLHNYPNALRQFQRMSGNVEEIIDLSVVDIVRDRHRGIPRFNDFREALHKPRLRNWEELSPDPETVRAIKALYGNIDMVDTMVGLHSEPPPDGFGFSDTAFRVFILMASRRLQSDRFLTVDFRPEIYSPLGLDWIENNGMTSIILRHCPQLAPVLPRTASAFAPFRPILP
ncbi:peroxidase family protein [Rhizobium ruizarguesonis]|uniref:peroxidase family protein n=1 Tax=Rhizobium ruizarguesonis TaxID=2081791 RepID=UPI00102FAA17|nr:peroxidase family protein [Rhizobium ruizarguesonis]TAZ23393.1 catalase [Rhizobium ruizarguesonis]TBD07699.1 catalase [Rhizobium ruizarguesonis]